MSERGDGQVGAVSGNVLQVIRILAGGQGLGVGVGVQR